MISILFVLALAASFPPPFAHGTSKIYRNVVDYGAKGDGFTDDTKAIIRALTEGRADDPSAVYPNATYSSSTLHPALVYFPSGTYLITETLPVIYYTQMLGEYQQRPILKFIPNSALPQQYLLDAEGSWYNNIPQNNFYKKIRNFIIDLESCDNNCIGVHWEVSQATSLSNILFKSGIGSSNWAIYLDHGSGGFVADLVIEGGEYGMWVGNQQFTVRNVTIHDTGAAGIYMHWGWVWAFKGISISNTLIGLQLGNRTGSAVVTDSYFANCTLGAVVTAFLPTTTDKATNCNLVLDNVVYDPQLGSRSVVTNALNAVVLEAPATPSAYTVRSFVQGHVWRDGLNTLQAIDLSDSAPVRPAAMLGDSAVAGGFFERPQPSFQDQPQIDVSTVGVIGDGQTDVTVPLRAALLKYKDTHVLKFPHGTYLITDTVYVPAGTRLLGEAWSVLMAANTTSDGAFSQVSSPTPMLLVGQPGERGTAQFVNFLISTRGPQPGAVLLRWHMADPATGPKGECGMWDVHFRIGGAVGTQIRPSDCPRGDGSTAPAEKCTGAWALLNIAPTGSLYMENVWGWVADHDIDAGSQVNVYNPRGALVESSLPVWMYGTAMEHSALFQYHLRGASNIVMSIIQTETPYYQPSLLTPFAPVAGDPSYCDYLENPQCNMAWALAVDSNSSDVFSLGIGSYSFFNVWGQTCLPRSCQPGLLSLPANPVASRINAYAINTYGAQSSLTTAEIGYAASDQNINTFCSTGIVDLN